MKRNNLTNIIETTLLRGKVKLLQPETGFHASTDSVFLAAAAPLKNNWQVLDMGCGVGTVGLCARLRNQAIQLTGIDIQEDLIDIAHQNASLNDANDTARYFSGNFLNNINIKDNFFNVALMNPPFQEAGTHTPSPNKIKATSHGEEVSGASLEDWIKCAHRKLKNGSYLVMIHRADRLDDALLHLCKKRWFGSIVIHPLYSRKGDPAKRVIIGARKERYAPTVLQSGLIVHQKNGNYTREASNVLDKVKDISLFKY